MKLSPRFLPHLAISVALTSVASSHAANKTWDGGGNPDFNWLTPANWNLDSAPVANDSLSFGGTIGLANTNNFTAGTSFAGLSFISGAGAFTLSGNSVTLGTGGGVTNSSTNTQTVALDLILSGASTHNFTARAGGNLTVSGNISGTTGLSTASGSGSTGVITLSGNNTYSGYTYHNSSTILDLASDTALGTSSLVVGSQTVRATGTRTINNDIILTGVSNFEGNLTVNGSTVLGNAAGSGRTFSVASGSTLTLNGAVTNGNPTFNPTSGMTKGGAGTLVLGGSNTFSGGMSINSGTVRLASTSAMITPTVLTMSLAASESAKLQLNGHNALVAGALTASFGTAGAVVGGAVIENGSTTDATLYIRGGGADANSIFAGTMQDGSSGKLSFSKNGSGTNLITNLLGTNTYTGDTIVNGGVLTSDYAYASSIGSASDGTISNAISSSSKLVLGGGTFQVKSRRAGTLTSSAGTWSANGTRITVAATANLAAGQAVSGTGIPAGAFIVRVVNNTQFDISIPAAAAGSSAALTFSTTGVQGASQTFNGATIASGASVLDAAVNTGGGASTIDLRGSGGAAANTRLAGGTVDFRASSGTYGTAAGQGMVKANFANDASGVLGAWATVSSGNDLARNDGSGNMVAYTSYTGIAARGGTIANGANTNVALNSNGTSGNVNLADTTTNINTLFQKNGNAATVDTAGKTLRLGTQGGILTVSGGGALTIGVATNEGVLTAGGSSDNTAGELIFNTNAVANNALTINSVIADNGTGIVSVTKSGGGTLNLNGTNTYTGSTYLNGGTTNITNNANLGAVATGATLYLNNATLAQTSAAKVTLANGSNARRNIVIGGPGATLDVAQANGGLEVSGVISSADIGSGGLTKSGLGTLSLTGNNTYSGGTTVNAGTVALGHNNALGSGILSIGTTGVRLQSADSNARVIGNKIASFSGSGTTSFGADGNNPGATGDITFSNTDMIYLSTNSTNTYVRTFEVAGSTRVTFAGGFGENANANNTSAPTAYGSTTLTKTGTGTLVLNGVSIYTGGTVVDAGTLIINAPIAYTNPSQTAASAQVLGSATGAINPLGGAAANTGGVVLGHAGTLAGTGAVVGLTTASGANSTFSPGDGSIGTLTLAGGLTAADGATFRMDLGANGSSDLIDFGASSLNLNDTITFVLNPVNITANQVYTLFVGTGTWTGGAPTFVFDMPTGYSLDTSYGGGNGYIFDTTTGAGSLTIAVVPEPRVVLLVTIGFMVVLIGRRTRRLA